LSRYIFELKAHGEMKEIVFSGINKSNSILFGNHDDLKISATGSFDLSGLVFCQNYTVMLSISGNGRIALRGRCKKIVIKKVEGDCELDLREFSAKELSCDLAKGNARIITGAVRIISFIRAEENSKFFHSAKSVCIASYVNDSAEIKIYAKAEHLRDEAWCLR
jgi:hypothetical protein